MGNLARLTLVIILLLVCLPLAAPKMASGDSWWDTDWNHRNSISFNASALSENLIDFPVMVSLNSTNFDFSEAQSDGQDMRFIDSDDSTELSYEIETWNGTGEYAILWVKVPQIDASSNYTDTMYMYYGNAGASDSQNAPDVWSNSYIAVYHLNESANGTTGEFYSSTGSHNGTGGDGDSTETPSRTGAVVGYGQSFDGTDDYIVVPDHDAFSITTTNNLTVSLWISPHELDMNDTGDYVCYFGKGGSGKHEWHFVYYNESAAQSQKLCFYVYGPAGGLGAGDYYNGDYAVDEWLRLVATTNCTDAEHGSEWLYRDAMDYNGLPQTWEFYGFTYTNGTADVCFGTYFEGTPAYPGWWDGRMDEIRISSIVRTNDWEKYSYYSDINSLLSFAAMETYEAPDTGTSTANITLTVTPGVLGGSCNVSFIDYGVITLATSANTNIAYVGITNTSTVTHNWTLQTANNTWIGGATPWTHSETATPDADQAGLKADRTDPWGGDDVAIPSASPVVIYGDCGALTDFDFGLSFVMPTFSTVPDQKTNAVELAVIEP